MSTSECTMSPASHGGLERYVGSCLISATARVKKNQHGPPGSGPGPGPGPGTGTGTGQRQQGSYNPNKKVESTEARGQPRGPQQQYGSGTRHYTWSGMPLISVASVNNNRRNRKQSEHQAGRPTPNRPTPNRPTPNRPVEAENPLSRLAIHKQGAPLILAGRYGGAGRKNSHPGPSVWIYRGGENRRGGIANGATDQSGNQSPKSVPSTPSSDSLSVASDESSGHSENSLPRIIKPRKRRKKDRKPPPMTAAVASEGVPTVSLKTLTDKQDADEPQLLHDFEDVKEADSVFFPSTGSDASSCQCRYCDPAGLIWDVARHCYSPFLTPPSPLLFSDLSPKTDLFSDHSDLVLRRSWSEPSPPTSSSEIRTTSTASSSPPSSSCSSSSVSTQSLEVFSEIVTSHNGHRDIEIKFFSSSSTPPATPLVAVALPDTPPPSPAALCSSEEKCVAGKGSIVVTTHPPQRPWIPLTRPKGRPSCIFTVMCYNVLCDKFATRQMYGYCPSWALQWEYRKKNILDEIRHYGADIISLQEVETDQFYKFFLPELKEDGYDGIFSPKSRAKTMSESDRKFVDGCAIFFRTAKFTLVKEHLVEFTQLAMANSEGSDHMLNRVMPKDNIGLAALLKTKEAAWDGTPDASQVQQPLLVCTAHIHWDPEYCDVKLVQTMMLSNELKSILDQAAMSFRPGHKPDPSSIQLLLCGDFNSLPDSGVIEFLTSGRVSADHPDFKELGYKSVLQKISGCDKPNEFTHSFKLASAYSEDIMPFTNYTFHFKGIIDYIFYSKQSMVPLGLLGPLASEWLRDNKVVGCPHPHVPSDHFPLLVELEMLPTVVNSNGLIPRR